MSIESVLFDLSDSSPLVHLIEEESPYRYLAIPIALAEAVALHNALDKIDGRRPGTHEVMSEVLRRLNADIVAARITRYDGGVFYAELDLMTPRGREIFDCRTSDALDPRHATGRSRAGAVRRVGAASLLRLSRRALIFTA